MLAFDADPAIRWLFCLTHPDDEISICVWIRRLVAAGADVFLSWTHDTELRKEEAEAAALALGVPWDRLYFHGATDGFVCSEIGPLLPQFEAMIEEIEPDRIACGAFEQGHLDHDATNYLVHQAYDGPVFEIPFYYPYLTRFPRVNRFEIPSGQEVIELTKEESRFKLDYAKRFPSQRIFTNMIFANLRAKLTGDGSLVTSERMRLQPPTDFRRPNHSPVLAQKIAASEDWGYWLDCLGEFEAARMSGG